nr:hypothetical protein [uncultured Tyzzerella sp.]
MDKLEFMKNNNIVIFVEIDLLNNVMDIKRRYEEELESYDIFYQHIIYNILDNKNLKIYQEYLEGQKILPRCWSQGKTKCIYCKPNDHKIVCLFYDFREEYEDNYFHAKNLNNKIQVMYNEI